jgi:hypothetical protein
LDRWGSSERRIHTLISPQANFYAFFTDINPATSRGATMIATIVGMVSLGGAIGVV